MHTGFLAYEESSICAFEYQVGNRTNQITRRHWNQNRIESKSEMPDRNRIEINIEIGSKIRSDNSGIESTASDRIDGGPAKCSKDSKGSQGSKDSIDSEQRFQRFQELQGCQRLQGFKHPLEGQIPRPGIDLGPSIYEETYKSADPACEMFTLWGLA